MGQGVALIIIMIFLLFLFFSAAQLQQSRFEIADIKQSLNLSAKALVKGIDQGVYSQDALANGFNQSNFEVELDRNALLNEFYEILSKNYYHKERVRTIKSHLILKSLVFYDRFYIANLQDQWSPPYFFTIQHDSNLYYLTILEGMIYTYEASGEKRYLKGSDIGLSLMNQNQLIIDKLNAQLAKETRVLNNGIPLAIEIKNPYIEGIDYQEQYGHFNPLEGITFFVVFGEGKLTLLDQQEFHFRNYNVVGYTLEKKR